MDNIHNFDTYDSYINVSSLQTYRSYVTDLLTYIFEHQINPYRRL